MTRRERQVAWLMLMGRNRYAIAAALGISRATVQHYITNIYVRLGVGNPVALFNRVVH